MDTCAVQPQQRKFTRGKHNSIPAAAWLVACLVVTLNGVYSGGWCSVALGGGGEAAVAALRVTQSRLDSYDEPHKYTLRKMM